MAGRRRAGGHTEDITMGEQPRSFEPGEDIDQAAADTDESPKAPPSKLSTERQLDHGLKETFPASDPVSINPGAD